ncbi:transglutaminase family protein [Collinsella sp. An2]|uniref:transglutaminase-like domain-containing protein n=1 Tax=Collinsella sp. An2 TaxID=1965585 RepID=UPI000B398DE6|nr:transglutaminase family protein [Collinsella sp. An2]OUP11127.1 transglutaminase [Collinsella sp. An2]
MKKLSFDYQMRLTFSAPVTDHRFQLRCIPATGPRQQIVDVEFTLEPDVPYETSTDSFDSVVVTGFIPQEHDTFGYRVTGIAFVDNEHIKPEPPKPLYRFTSALTEPGPVVSALVARCEELLRPLPGGATPVERAQVIMNEVYRAFTYTPGSTTVRTTAEEALAQGKGVCQDYAHVMLAVCRSCGIVARYIAGMLAGEGATHAWVEVYHGDRWIGLDPTHNRLVNDDYITIAHGRDYRDCMLDIGIFSGVNVQQTQWVNAAVHERA